MTRWHRAVPTIPTGIPSLDQRIGGLVPGELVVLLSDSAPLADAVGKAMGPAVSTAGYSLGFLGRSGEAGVGARLISPVPQPCSEFVRRAGEWCGSTDGEKVVLIQRADRMLTNRKREQAYASLRQFARNRSVAVVLVVLRSAQERKRPPSPNFLGGVQARALVHIAPQEADLFTKAGVRLQLLLRHPPITWTVPDLTWQGDSAEKEQANPGQG
jgi:replicative DNA helicase